MKYDDDFLCEVNFYFKYINNFIGIEIIGVFWNDIVKCEMDNEIYVLGLKLNGKIFLFVFFIMNFEYIWGIFFLVDFCVDFNFLFIVYFRDN